MTTEELRAMPLHGDKADKNYCILRVPGGWIYESRILSGPPFFVPDPLERAAVEIAAGMIGDAVSSGAFEGLAPPEIKEKISPAAKAIARAVLEEVGK